MRGICTCCARDQRCPINGGHDNVWCLVFGVWCLTFDKVCLFYNSRMQGPGTLTLYVRSSKLETMHCNRDTYDVLKDADIDLHEKLESFRLGMP